MALWPSKSFSCSSETGGGGDTEWVHRAATRAILLSTQGMWKSSLCYYFLLNRIYWHSKQDQAITCNGIRCLTLNQVEMIVFGTILPRLLQSLKVERVEILKLNNPKKSLPTLRLRWEVFDFTHLYLTDKMDPQNEKQEMCQESSTAHFTH